jgi:ABC-2 type transport system ATP-binding protein
MVFMIEAKNIVKEFKYKIPSKNKVRDFFFPKFKHFNAVDNVSLKVRKGEIFGLVGPNGAGKTTLIKILTGLLSPTMGEVLIEGNSIEKEKQFIGLMLGNEMIYYRMTGFDNLKYFAKLYNVKNYEKKIRELAEMLGLTNWLSSFVENYSQGMKSKLALARALINDPKILFLDEPTVGLDPQISNKIRKKIKEMHKTVFLTTHNLSEAVELCSRIAVMNKGKIISIDHPKNFKDFEKEFLKLVSENE